MQGQTAEQNQDEKENKVEQEEIVYFEGLQVLNIENWQSTKDYKNIVGWQEKKDMEQKGYYTVSFNETDENGKVVTHNVYIPEGFYWKTIDEDSTDNTLAPWDRKEKIFKIKSETNENMVFVWISTANLDLSKNVTVAQAIRTKWLEVIDDYNSKYGTDIKYPLIDIESTLSPDIEYSIKNFGGFYLAENELGYNSAGQMSTTVRPTVNANDGSYKLQSGTIPEMYTEVNNKAQEANDELGNNENIIVSAVPLALYEAVNIKMAGTEEGQKVVITGINANNKTASDNPENQTVEEAKNRQNQEISNYFGATSEATGNATGNFAGEININGTTYKFNNQEEAMAIIMRQGGNWSSETDIKKNGTPNIDFLNEDEMKIIEADTSGLRLCLYLTDVNRHANYFDIMTESEIMKGKDEKLKEIIKEDNTNKSNSNVKVAIFNESKLPKGVKDLELVIPEKVNGQTFEYVIYNSSKKIKKVDDSISTKIGNNAFVGCTSLESVTMNNIKEIGKGAFSGCTKLEQVNISSAFGTTIMGTYNSKDKGAFEGCTSLESVTMKSVNAIGNKSFKNCTNLKNVNFSIVQHIGESAFEECTALENFNINGKTDVIEGSIEQYAFKNCKKLKNFVAGKQENMQQGDTSGGNMPAGGMPGGDMPSGEMPGGDMPSGEMPGGDMPSGEMPGGDMPSGGMPGGDMPSGGMPGGDMPSGGMENAQQSNYQSFEKVDSTAFDGCERLEKIIIGNVGTLNDNTYLNDIYTLGNDGLFKTHKKLTVVKIGNNEFKRRSR